MKLKDEEGKVIAPYIGFVVSQIIALLDGVFIYLSLFLTDCVDYAN